jgi:hypothetical protein
MKSYSKEKAQQGQIMVMGILTVVILLILGGTLVFISGHNAQRGTRSTNSTKAFYVADAGIEYALYRVLTAPINVDQATLTTFNRSNQDMSGAEGTFSVTFSTTSWPGRYQVVAEGYYPNAINPQAKRKIAAKIARDLPSQVFDYSYFINNWGWYWGHDITSNGNVRSNGRFDFVDGPMVNGHIYAHEEIDDHGTPVRGTGGQPDHQHQNVAEVTMPDLQDLSYYESKAIASTGTISIGGTTLINGVYGDDAGETGNIVLVGTPSNPIEINGTVVVRGDLILKGTVQGQGTIYTGRNAYIAGTVSYKDPPSSPRPASESSADYDTWVQANKDKDFLAVASKANVILGDYTKDSYFGYSGSDQWYSDQWLFDMTKADGSNYGWSDVQTQTDITNFTNLPSGVTQFGNLATNDISKVEGIYYTQNAFAGRVGNDIKFDGSIISKDEAIIYRNNVTFNYDERANSRYNNDPNRFVDLGLPSIDRVYIVEWLEVD